MNPWVIQLSKRGPEAVDLMRRNFLAEVIRECGPPEAPSDEAPAPDALGAGERALLCIAAISLGDEVMGIYRKAGLSPTQGKAAMENLVAKGLIRVHRLPRAGRGAPWKTIEVLPAADVELAKAGLKRKEPPLKGSWLHSLYGYYVGRWAEGQGFKSVQFEKTYGPKTFDLAWQNAGGEIETVEICLTGAPQRTAEQLQTSASNKGIARIFAFVENRKSLDQTREALIQQDRDGICRDRMDFRLIGEVIETVLGKAR